MFGIFASYATEMINQLLIMIIHFSRLTNFLGLLAQLSYEIKQ